MKSYFKVTDRQTQSESCWQDEAPNYRTSDTVTSDEGRKKVILVGSDFVGLFPSMKEVNTGRAVGKKVHKSPCVVKVTRYVSGNINL